MQRERNIGSAGNLSAGRRSVALTTGSGRGAGGLIERRETSSRPLFVTVAGAIPGLGNEYPSCNSVRLSADVRPATVFLFRVGAADDRPSSPILRRLKRFKMISKERT
ncbi:hypothetical protein EVAR_46586_1 [Eumeta japonica]|uniref:Uncharacterized protein n=1 Tax=Eumeta variegata TaxID=151549 RepID=A0A4C1WSN1_EUMVA|nr:hypothetical protein EVAR_46586_1 [Eumeta japonica]